MTNSENGLISATAAYAKDRAALLQLLSNTLDRYGISITDAASGAANMSNVPVIPGLTAPTAPAPPKPISVSSGAAAIVTRQLETPGPASACMDAGFRFLTLPVDGVELRLRIWRSGERD